MVIYYRSQTLRPLLVAVIALTAGVLNNHEARAQDATAEAQAISRQVVTHVAERNLGEAELLAKRGLSLCSQVIAVKGHCFRQFNESLGDIASIRGNFPEALDYFLKSFKSLDDIPGVAEALILRSKLRIGTTYFAMRRLDDAEPLLIEVGQRLSRTAPADPGIPIAYGTLRELYKIKSKPAEEAAAARGQFDYQTKYGANNQQSVQKSKLALTTALIRQARQLSGNNNDGEAERILFEGIKLLDPPQSGEEQFLASLLEDVGVLYQKRRRFSEAEPYLLRSLDYRRKFPVPDDPNLPIGLANLGAFYQDLGKQEACIPYMAEAIQKFDEARAENATLGFALSKLGVAYKTLGRYREAEATLLRAIEVQNRVISENDPRRMHARVDLGSMLLDQERLGEAEQVLRSALEIEPRLTRPATGWRSAVLTQLGMVYRDQGRYEEAAKLFREAIALDESELTNQPQGIALHYTEFAGILRRQYRYSEAESALLKSLAMEQPELDRAGALNSLGLLYINTAQYDKAEAALNQALAIRTKLLSESHFWTAQTLSNLAALDGTRGLHANAETKLRRVLEIVNRSPISQPTTPALYSSLLAETLLSQDKLDEAETLVRSSSNVLMTKLGAEHPRYATALKTLGAIEMAREQNRRAEAAYRQALAIDERAFGTHSEAVAADLTALAEILRRTGSRLEARSDIERAIAIIVDRPGADSLTIARALLTSATLSFEEGRYDTAQSLAHRAVTIRERNVGPDHPSLIPIMIFLSRIETALGRSAEAALKLDQAARIVDKATSADTRLGIEVLLAKADAKLADGRTSDATNDAREAVAIATRHYGEEAPLRKAAINRLASILIMQDAADEARRLLQDELGVTEAKLGRDHIATAPTLRKLAAILSSSGDQSSAIALYRRALMTDNRVFGPESDQAAADHLALGSLLRTTGHFDEARGEVRLACSAPGAKEHGLLASSCLNELATLAVGGASLAEAIIFSNRMLATVEKNYGADSPVLAGTLAQLGRLYLLNGEKNRAAGLLVRIESLVGSDIKEGAPGILGVLQLRAELSAAGGQFDQAIATLMRAREIAIKSAGHRSTIAGNIAFNLAVVHLSAERLQEAITLFLGAIEILKRESGDRSPNVGYALLGTAEAYKRLGDEVSSKALSAAAAEILGPTMAAQRRDFKWL